MNTFDQILEQQAAWKAWVAAWNWKRQTAITLTCKQGIMEGAVYVACDESNLRQNMRHFLNKLCKKMKIKSEELLRLIVTEGTVGRLHQHLAVSRPEHISEQRFEELIKDVWATTKWGRPNAYVTHDANLGWAATYLLKLRTKPDFSDSIDLDNSHSV